MRVNHFIVMLTFVYALAVSAGFLAYRSFVVFPQLQQFTLQNHQNDVQALGRVFQAEADHLELLLIDWAKWDDFYEFVRRPSDAFRQSNLMSDTFIDANLSGAYIMDKRRNLIFGVQHPYGTTETYSISESSSDFKKILGLEYPEDDEVFCGYIQLHGVLNLYCIATAQDSNVKEPGNGYLMFSREVSEAFLDQIKAITNTQFQLVNPSQITDRVIPITESDKITQPKSSYFLGMVNKDGGYDFIVNLYHDEDEFPKKIDLQTWILLLGLLFVPVVIFLGIRFFLVKPLSEMSNFILRIKTESNPPEFKDYQFIFEIRVFRDAVYELMEHLKLEKNHYENLSLTDALTGIHNRRAFDRDVKEMWLTCARQNNPFVLILADIDYFKKYNDALGHQKGDEAIRETAQALRKICKRAGDGVYRYGGEEFAILMAVEQTSDLDGMLDAFQIAVKDLGISHPESSVSEILTISLGACLISRPGRWMNSISYESALKKADKALYSAKMNGRDGHVIITIDEVKLSED
ncbi:MAG: diguanylate cyclase [Gammaproteobacteria bacterium]|nr:diguanylate cyclase [Gammaproteobacteria bacterium]